MMNNETIDEINPPSPPELPPIPDLNSKPGYREIFEGLLRSPQQLVPLLERSGNRIPIKLAVIALSSFLLFGFVLGCFAKHEQLWAAPLKMVGGMAFASLICFPSLYVFSTLAGGRFSPRLLFTCLTGSLALMGLLLLGFAPAVWIFVESTNSLGFMGFLSLFAWLISLMFGFRFLMTCNRLNGATQASPIVLWSMVFIVVTLQLSTSLRPILGRSDRFLQLEEKRFFLQHWFQTMDQDLVQKTENKQQRNGSVETSPESTNGSRNPFTEE